MAGRTYCPDCGQPHAAGARFCGRCGRELPFSGPPPEAPPVARSRLVWLLPLLLALFAGGGYWWWAGSGRSWPVGNDPAGDGARPAELASLITVSPIPEQPGGAAGLEPLPSQTQQPVSTATAVATPSPSPSNTPSPSPAPSVTPQPTPTPLPTPAPAPVDFLISDFVTAPLWLSPPLIDGDLAEWTDMPVYYGAHRVFAVDGWDGSADLDAYWRLAWDPVHLYVAVTVVDDIHVQTQTGPFAYQGDSLEIQFSRDPQRDSDQNRLRADHFQLLLSPGDFQSVPFSSYRWRGTGEGRWADAPGQLIAIAAREIEGGYQLEAAVPWFDLDLTPREGLLLGIALNASDNDSPGTAVQEVMMSTAPDRTFLSPATWGTLRLGG